MMKVFKWLYELGVEAMRREMMHNLTSAAQYHRMKAEIETSNPTKIDDTYLKSSDEMVLPPSEHIAAAGVLEEQLRRIEPQRERN